MLSSLSIQNYAIIKELEVTFHSGFCVMTGETGAGKSIIMGALGLILGQRADTTVLHNNNGKCAVEGKFDVYIHPKLQQFFLAHDLDEEIPVILRREITPSGKSRAFINDTPVQLSVIKELGLQLIDIHSQHSNLELGKRGFQMNVLDWYCDHQNLLEAYSASYKTWKNLTNERSALESKASQAKADIDYYQFQFDQLDKAQLEAGEQEALEDEQEKLNHSEDIKLALNTTHQLLNSDEAMVLANLKEAVSSLSRITDYMPEVKELYERLESQYIEMNDIASECEQLAESVDHDPKRLQFITERLDTLYSLQQKHGVNSVNALIELRNNFDEQLQSAASYQDEIDKLDQKIAVQNSMCNDAAVKLSKSRQSGTTKLEKAIGEYLRDLGMPNARLEVRLQQTEVFKPNGVDEVAFLFTANKGGMKEEIHKVASGGELSRLMLAIKTVVAKSKALPAIIFDEIDSGISGEIAGKMGKILKSMAQYMQVISITHLPQIASQGDAHFLVFKEEDNTSTQTGIRILSKEERILEIAKMLSGEQPNKAAISNAESLINN